MATLLTNRSQGNLTLPAVYANQILPPGAGIVIADTPANVSANFPNVTPPNFITFDLVSDGQAKVTPGFATPQIQNGVATLVGGTKSITAVTITANSRIYLTRNTPGGAVGDLSAPSASRTVGAGTGSFVINSASGTDTSTVDWTIVG